MASDDARVALMRQLQARGAVRLDMTVSLLGDYREDDDRQRWRIVVTGIEQARTFCGRTEIEAIESAITAFESAITASLAPVAVEPDPFPSGPPYR